MTLLETITGVWNGAKQAKAIAEGIIAIDAKVKDSTHNKELAELNNKLAEILNALTESMVEVSKLTVENLELQNKLMAKDDVSKFTHDDGVLLNPELPGVIYCVKCKEDNGRKSVMSEQDAKGKYSTDKKYICNDCGHIAGTYKRPPLPAPRLVQPKLPHWRR